MKKFLLVAILSCFVSAVFAQGNLQFNNVFYQKLSSTWVSSVGTMQTNSVSIVVPAGKVLKIEGARINTYQISNGNASQQNVNLNLDDVIIAHDYSVSSTASRSDIFPMWLPAGTYTLKMNAFSISSTNFQSSGVVSGIMFNVVP